MAILELRSLGKTYPPGTKAVEDVSLAIEADEIVCLLGPSGCGKTTLLRLIAGLEIPDSGQVWFEGQDMVNVAPYRRDFGMMFQDFALFPHLNVAQNVAFGLEMHGQTKDQVERRVEAVLQLVDLPGYGGREIAQLSGGEQQRVALARALAPEPRLLMLDEPLGALDRALREHLMLELRQILKQVGVTAVYVTHDQTEAFAVADRIALMNAGRLEQVDTPQQIFFHPATPFAARFLGFQNLLEGIVLESTLVKTSLGEFRTAKTDLPAGSPVVLLLRPDAAHLAGEAVSDMQNVVDASVDDTSFRGKYSQVWFAAGRERLMFEFPANPPSAGESVRLAISPQATNILPA